MAKAKRKSTSGKKGKTVQSKKNKNQELNLNIIGTIVFSILLAVLLYTNSGELGQKLNEVLGGLIGILRFILPIGTFAIAIKMACKDEEDYVTKRIVQYAIMIICIAIIMSVYEISSGNIDVNANLSINVKKAYSLGVTNQGGGAIGTVAAIFLVKKLGNLGAVVLSVGISVMLFAFVCGIDISEYISKKVEEYIERQEEKKIQKEERRKKREEYLAAQRSQMNEARKQKEQSSSENVKMHNKEIAAIQDIQNQNIEPEQIKINLNGRVIEDETKEPKRGLMGLLKKSNSGKKESVTKTANSIMKIDEETGEILEESPIKQANLFVQEEEQKQDKTKEVLQLEHTLAVEEDNYVYPPIDILKKMEKPPLIGGKKTLTDTATRLQKTLYSFGVSAKVENVTVGPAITRYELKPAEGVRVSKIANLADDIALNLAAETIRIEAPIPGKQAVGIEVPNKQKEMVGLREVIESEKFKENDSKLSVALGKDVAGEAVIANIAKMPHVLIAGSTGSGKSVCINTIITSIIYNSKPSEVKLVMVDPKVVELSVYNGIPHLLIPVVTDPKKAAGALAWAVQEMDNRYNLFAEKGVRDLTGYNKAAENEDAGKLPQIVIIIDELADLMMVAAKEVEESICRLAQKARAAGMHLVIATQRPSVDVITGLIKANVPSRIAFAVSSQVDSRTILDQVGAEKLLGKGDMLYFPSGASKPTRVQGAFVSDEEVEQIVNFIKSNGTAVYSEDILDTIENGGKDEQIKNLAAEQAAEDDTDPFLQEAIDTVVETGQASTSFIQRKFKVGYARAGRIIDQMEERGVISGYQGSKPREVLWTLEKLAEMKMGSKAEE